MSSAAMMSSGAMMSSAAIMPSAAMASQTSDDIDDSGSTSTTGSTITMAIQPTKSSDKPVVQMATRLDSSGSDSLQASFTELTSESEKTQFPMQKATQPLPGNLVALTTTESVPLSATQVDQSSQSELSSSMSDSQTNDVKESMSSSTEIQSSVGDGNSILVKTADVASTSLSASVSQTSDISDGVVPSVSDYYDQNDPFDPNAATKASFITTQGKLQTTSVADTDFSPLHSSLIRLSPAPSVPGSTGPSRALYSTYTPTETKFTTAAGGRDTGSMQMSSTSSLPPPTLKPLETSPQSQSTILGGTSAIICYYVLHYYILFLYNTVQYNRHLYKLVLWAILY